MFGQYDTNDSLVNQHALSLLGLKMHTNDQNDVETKNYALTIFNPNGQNVHRNFEKLEISFKSDAEFILWQNSFSRVLYNDRSVSGFFKKFDFFLQRWPFSFLK